MAAAVSDFDQLHPQNIGAAAAERLTIRTEAEQAIHGQPTAADAIRNEMRRMTQRERWRVAQSMIVPDSSTSSLPSAKPQYNRTGDVTALTFETADHKKFTVHLMDKPGEPHLNTKEHLLLNGVTRAITTDQHGKVFSVDDSDGGAIRRDPAGGPNAYVRIHPDGTREALDNVSATAHGALAFSFPGPDGAHERTVEKVNAQGDIISEVHQDGKPTVTVVQHKDGTNDVMTSAPGMHGTTVDVDLKSDDKQNDTGGSLAIRYPDGRTATYTADFKQHPEAARIFNGASTMAQSGETFDINTWVANHQQYLVPSTTTD